MEINITGLNKHIPAGGFKRGELVTMMGNTKTERKYDVSRILIGDELHQFVAYDEGTQNVNQVVTDLLNGLLRMAITNTSKSTFTQHMLNRFLLEHCNIL